MDRQVLDDEVADELIQRYTADNPSRGERMIGKNNHQCIIYSFSITLFYTEG